MTTREREMKQFVATVAVVLAVLCQGCRKDDEGGKTIPQAPADITLSAESIQLERTGGDVSLTVTAPSRPSVSAKPDWVTVVDGTYNPETYKITYTLKVSAYSDYGSRTGELTFQSGSLSKKLTINQKGREESEESLDANLTNPQASAQAKNVYAFLLEQNGGKMLSGVQSGGTANNNERVNQIYTLTGKHPALAGYDYIFLQYSPTPAGWSWVVNYADISAPREQWENNGLVSFMWHWNVPNSKADWDNGKAGNFDGYNFYTEKTSFSIQNALTEGTWEHDFILQDIEKVAGYLKLLQEENIPVIWRPLHEAAGNYNLYDGIPNNAWFWWGKGGAEACKQLWKLLRDKLEGEYGLNNLIWVWTLDATPGAESEWDSWYPGNDCVDMVGVDIYANDTEAKRYQYQAAVNLSGGRKMVTVSECGNIPDPAKCFAQNQAWSWFLAWDLESYPLNTNDYWKQLMSSSQVLTRESMPSLK